MPTLCIVCGYNIYLDFDKFFMMALPVFLMFYAVVAVTYGKDVCKFETLEISCGDDEVIVMTSSLYGRMKDTRCIKQNFGYVGVCYKSVLHITHRRCSGKQKCSIDMPDKEMANSPWSIAQACPDDLSVYLTANHTCQKVIKPKPTCTNEKVYLTGKGNISSFISRKSKCGSPDSPIVIQGENGQQIKIGLIDYGSESNGLAIGDTVAMSSQGSLSCHHLPVYAILRDTVDHQSQSHTVCGGRGVSGKHMDVFLSKGHQVEVRIQGRDDENAREFLLSYQVIGCPDLLIGTSGTWTRHGHMATYRCTEGSKEWSVKCEGGKWSGNYVNCSSVMANPAQGAVLGGGGANYSWFSMTLELAIVLVCSIAFVVGVLIVVVGIFIIKRKQMTDAQTRAATQYYQHPICAGTMPKDAQDPHNPVHTMTMSARDGSQIPNIMYSRQNTRSPSQGREHHEHDYAYVDEHIISGINRPMGVPQVTVPPPVPAHTSFGMPPMPPIHVRPVSQPQPDSVSLPDFEYLTHGYNTLDSRNFSALERESKRNRGHLEDNNNENRYS